jgi:CRISPR/Cas system-associated endonuclease/helicase Cas3
LSFRTGFRELASLVSLLQTAGRINREGLCDDAEMWTFCLAEDDIWTQNPELKHAEKILRNYFKKGEKIQPELTTRSISDEIKRYGLPSIKKELLKPEEGLRFPVVESEFKVIKEDTTIAIVDENLAKRVLAGDANWLDIQRNSVNINISKYSKNFDAVEEIIPGLFHWRLGYDDFLGYLADIVRKNRSLVVSSCFMTRTFMDGQNTMPDGKNL